MATKNADSAGTAKEQGNPKGYMSIGALALLAAAAVVTSLRGLPVMAKEEMTMFFFIGFATLLFLIPSALVAAELGSAFSNRSGGVYTWVSEAFGQRWGFVAIWLQWIQNVVWYPTGLSFAAAALAYGIGLDRIAGNRWYVGVFCIVVYWLATLLAFRGNAVIAKIANYGFFLGTIIPGVLLLVLFVYWMATGHTAGWNTTTDPALITTVAGHTHLRFWPEFTNTGSLAFLGNVVLLFTGVEAQAVHVRSMKNPRHGFPIAMLLAGLISLALFTLGAIAVAGLLPANEIDLQIGVFTAFQRVLTPQSGLGWVVNIASLLIAFGALGGVFAWIGSPSRGLLSTARDGVLPPFMQRTTNTGVPRNVLLTQAIVVTVISTIYFAIKNVGGAFFLISSMTVTLYIVMYLLMYAAVIKLRYSQPDLVRNFQMPGGKPGVWLLAGSGFLAVAFSLVMSFFPPENLEVGTPQMYVALVASGLIIFVGAPLIIYQKRKPSWVLKAEADDKN